MAGCCFLVHVALKPLGGTPAAPLFHRNNHACFHDHVVGAFCIVLKQPRVLREKPLSSPSLSLPTPPPFPVLRRFLVAVVMFPHLGQMTI